MKKLFMALLSALVLPAWSQTSLSDCQEAAARNYPLIRKYDLIRQTTAYTVANLNKGWLPQVSALAQATWQNRVAQLPDALSGMMTSMGYAPEGLKKDQYKVGIDVSQTIWDGGRIRNRKQMENRLGDVQTAEENVTMYAVRGRVNELFFSVLATDERMKATDDLLTLLAANEQKLSAMLRNGVATQSDVDAVKAERMKAMQQQTELKGVRRAALQMLSLFCGYEVQMLSKPPVAEVAQTVERPELQLIDRRIQWTEAAEHALKADLMPRLSVFVQGYYGYPSYNMFDDIMTHRWRLNGLIGARLTWNIASLYTYKNEQRKLESQRRMAENSREVFLFNNSIEQVRQRQLMETYRQLMADDEEIIRLRGAVRKAAESKLDHGIIDVNQLIQELTRENDARNRRSAHEMEMLKALYDLRFAVGEAGN